MRLQLTGRHELYSHFFPSYAVAYRCRTCGVSPCMSLCAECFHQGNHEGHDFNMFRSQAGGACDCGDVSVMRSEGFCSRHGPDHVSRSTQIPVELTCVPSAVLPQILFRLVLQVSLKSKRKCMNLGYYVLLTSYYNVFVFHQYHMVKTIVSHDT